MVTIIADDFSAYQRKKIADLLVKLRLKYALFPPAFDVSMDKENALIIIISAKNKQIQNDMIKLYPWAQLCVIPKSIDDIVGITAVLDLKMQKQNIPERNQLKKLLIEYSKQVHEIPQVEAVEMPREILLSGGEDVMDFLETFDTAPLIVCQLTEEIALGIYQEETKGYYPLEFTRQDARRLANLMTDLTANIIGAKDELGIQHQIHAS